MATRTRTQARPTKQVLAKPDLLDIYRVMYLSRRLVDKEIQLKRQNKIFFQISGAGHYSVPAPAGPGVQPAYDSIFPYYPDLARRLVRSMPPARLPPSCG